MVEKLTGTPALGRFNFKAELEELVPFLTKAVGYLRCGAVAHSQHDAHVVVILGPGDLVRKGRGGEGRGAEVWGRLWP